ncbi:LysR family transcriptional regulator [Salmonella enterica subsp. enterica serovar Teshie]|uniref:LysR family transcriptional regulator n=1 Tax=Salmonella enterica TaxID=28901 RepID=A0A763XL18_SALER|nr:LysR family transcriptional regulator [Salmonella enterica]EBR9810779.1 LysR family transcriptional regulator [Salmonella enterica subsp. enterica serovar Teshie]ECD6621006.1 LysR family transcriptional regulator [Salmonella enterica subsp. enterica]EBA4958970.1 LysR family transcriptional regulator [Salmonella enterica]EBU9728894.1 LysR family transcriptional regulator [Salmonella enterica subsp. enterica serovar Teshie]EBV3613170.1 LysR family transcriptional regulator [Salmonella enteric
MNLLQMDMNLLKVLYVLLETSSTGKTAQKLALSPSAVSHALMRLRDALNDPLFRREGNRQIATPYAQALRDKLAPVFVSLNEELFGDKENGSRCFRVVLPPALNALLTPVLAEKGHLHQAVIECLPFARRPWRDELLDSSVDLVLAIGDHQKQVSALHYERVGTTRLIAVYGAPLRSRLENAAALNFADLQHYQHIYCLPWTKENNELDRQQARAGFERPLAFVCHDYSQLAPAVQSAPLMAIVPRPWYENLPDKHGLFVLPLAGEQAEGAIFMQYRASTVEWKRRLIDAIRRKLKTYYR